MDTENSHTRVVLELRSKWRWSVKLNICQYYLNMFEIKLVRHIIYYIIYLTCGAMTMTKLLKLACRKEYREEKYSSKKKLKKGRKVFKFLHCSFI